MAQPYFEIAEEVEKIALKLINELFPFLKRLRIKYMFREGKWSAQRKETWGKVVKFSAIQMFMNGGYQYGVIINQLVWYQLKTEQKEALIDHELSHFVEVQKKKGHPAITLRGHDVEDFISVIGRRGYWTPDLKKMDEEQRQLKLFDKEPDKSESKDKPDMVVTSDKSGVVVGIESKKDPPGEPKVKRKSEPQPPAA